ncbi:MAG: PD-(D/E)XK nuclease family protein [Clostridia bacterium]|nr:PD-(D/E)XK nuclease family protein [Clostridia bacterium]
MLKFLLGTAEADKINEIYRRAKADSDLGKSVFILVPEQYSMYAEQELISRLGLSAQNKIQILTFSRLSNMIFSKLGPLRTKYIDKTGKYLLACRSMQLCQSELTFFGKNISQSGFASLIVSAISEFKRYGVLPADLIKQSKECENGVLSAKLSDLALIYQKFDELVDENYINAEDNLAIAMTKIKDADFLSGTLYINHFATFTPIEYEVIKSLMTKMDICVSLCTDTVCENSVLFSSQVKVLSRLNALAKETETRIDSPIFIEATEISSATPELWHLRENYFSYTPKAIEGNPSSIHVLLPQNYYSEVQHAAGIINRLCRTKGYRLNDILILTGSLETYELIIPAVFEEFGINYFLDQKIRLAESPFMRMIVAIFEILAFGFSYERVMTILRSGFWNITKSDADIFENYILAADISHKQWQSRDKWVYNPRPSAFDLETINQIKIKILDPILDLVASFSGRKSIRIICKNFCDWLNAISIYETVSKKIEKFKEDKNPEAEERLVRVWSSFVSVINQISDCMGDTPATFTEFYELFCSCCNELSVGIIPPTQDKVMISEAQRFRSTGAKAVIVLGVTDKVFPKSHSSEGILSDAERLYLKESGLTLAPDTYTRQKEEQFLIYSVFSTATEELYLLSPVSDKEGKSLGSSEVLKRLKSSVFPDIEFKKEDTGFDMFEGRNHTFYELCARLFECGFNLSLLPPMWKTIYEYFENDIEYAKKLLSFRKMHLQSSEPPAISKALAKKLYGSPLLLSVSKLEKYNSCAFSFFMRYGLLAEERLLGGLKPTDTGSILHDILCRYFKDKSEKNADYAKISHSQCCDEIAALVNEYAKESDNTLFVSSNYYGYMLMRLKNIASATAWKLIRFYSQSAFRPSGFEVGFGRRGSLPPYEISTKDGKVLLEGFIDRVDSADIGGQEFITVTDYKSSEKRIDSAMIDAGITIQPLIYANAIAKGNRGAIPAAMMYLQMSDPILKFENPPSVEEWEAAMSDNIKVHGLFLDSPEVLAALDPDPDNKNAVHYINCDKKSRLVRELFEKRLKGAEDCAANTAEKISDGIIDPNPPDISGFDPCSYCPYGSICRED